MVILSDNSVTATCAYTGHHLVKKKFIRYSRDSNTRSEVQEPKALCIELHGIVKWSGKKLYKFLNLEKEVRCGCGWVGEWDLLYG